MVTTTDQKVTQDMTATAIAKARLTTAENMAKRHRQWSEVAIFVAGREYHLEQAKVHEQRVIVGRAAHTSRGSGTNSPDESGS